MKARGAAAGHVGGIAGLSRYTDGAGRQAPIVRLVRRARLFRGSQLIVIARDDDTTFGILHSRFHGLWSLCLCTWLGKGNDPCYAPNTTFEMFPLPAGLTRMRPRSATAYEEDSCARSRSRMLRADSPTLRDRWLHPPERVEWVDEPTPGYPLVRASEPSKEVVDQLHKRGRLRQRTAGPPRSPRSRRAPPDKLPPRAAGATSHRAAAVRLYPGSCR